MKAKVYFSRRKKMVLAFFDSKSLIYTNHVTRGTTLNTKYIMDALVKFLKFSSRRGQ
jgi:hypothetical protein